MFDMEFWLGIATAILAERTLDMLGYGLYRAGYRQGLRDIEPSINKMEEALKINQQAADSIQRMLSLPFDTQHPNHSASPNGNRLDVEQY